MEISNGMIKENEKRSVSLIRLATSRPRRAYEIGPSYSPKPHNYYQDLELERS
jgi:hypothetical protein